MLSISFKSFMSFTWEDIPSFFDLDGVVRNKW